MSLTYQTKRNKIIARNIRKEETMFIPTTAYEITYTTKSRKGNVITHTEVLLNSYIWDFFKPAPVEDLAEFVKSYFKGKLVKARRVSVILSLIKRA